MFLKSLTGTNLSEMGAEPLNPFAISQGNPFSFSFCLNVTGGKVDTYTDRIIIF